MKYIFLILFSLLSVFYTHADERVGLTLIPPGKISNKINLDIRGGIVNHGNSLRTYRVSLYWGKEKTSALLCDTTLQIAAGQSDMVKIVLPMQDKVGKHKVILKVSDGKRCGWLGRARFIMGCASIYPKGATPLCKGGSLCSVSESSIWARTPFG